MSPRSTQQFDKIRQQSRTKIMDTALELFGTYGYHSTSVSKIAKAAGISKGLMYNYFNSKEDLLHSIIIESIEEHESWWNEFTAMDISAYEKLRLTTEKSVSIVQEDLHHWQLLTSLIFQPETKIGLEGFLGQKQGEIMAQIIGIFSELDVKDPKKEAFFYGACLDGMFLHYMQMEDQYPLEEMKDFLLKRYQK